MKRIVFVMALALMLTSGASLAADFNGDGTGDIAIFRESSGLWSVRSITRVYFGTTGDAPVPADYDGSGTDIIGIFRPSSGLWAVRSFSRAYFGTNGDLPLPGDYEGDGTCEPGIFRSTSGLWAVIGTTRFYYGTSGDAAISPGKVGGRRARLLKTGQFTEYSSGDDGTYQAGVEFSYQTNDPAGNGEIVTIDNMTGLMWASDGSAAGCFNSQTASWDEAIAYCNTLTFAGYSDWRLPNVLELVSIHNFGISYPALDPVYFPNAPSNFCWTSTTWNNLPVSAWLVNPNSGGMANNSKSVGYCLRAVRGGL